MSFSVTVLGSGSAVPTSRRGLTSHFVDCNNRYILIDCGEGTQLQIRKFGIKFQRIEHILISHLHGDHYFGLVGLLSTMHLMGRVKAIQVYGPKGLQGIIESQLNYDGARLDYDIQFTELENSKGGVVFEDKKVRIEHFPLSHRVPTNGFVIREKEKERRLNIELAMKDQVKIEYFHRLKKGENVIDETGRSLEFDKYTFAPDKPKAYAFCSDTKYHEPVVPFIQGVELLYHEATFTEKFIDRAKATSHSTAVQAATIAMKAEVGTLLMGHFSARYDTGKEHIAEASTVFENCIAVEDGETYQV
ncbi:MAG: ribonuclease Z [Crocinitomicaceae bacterium]|nr:ribonuclease Z [Crocinitomicaceae bacterium]